MIRKLINWFLKNVLLGAIPLLAELIIRWAAGQDVFSSEKNIPELMFLVAMVSLGTADDVERASEVLDETKAEDKALKETLTNWHNLLMAGMVIASMFFGGYLVVDTLGTGNKTFLPHILLVAWAITGLLFTLALIAEIFINRSSIAPLQKK
jgi:hypothetical protein